MAELKALLTEGPAKSINAERSKEGRWNQDLLRSRNDVIISFP